MGNPLDWEHINRTGDYAWQERTGRAGQIQVASSICQSLTYDIFRFVSRTEKLPWGRVGGVGGGA